MTAPDHVTVQPNDLLEYRCPTFGIVWQWRVLSCCHGGDRQEGLIELEPVMAAFGQADGRTMKTVWVPEPMTRALKLIRRGPPNDRA